MRFFGERIEMSNQAFEVVVTDIRFETQFMLEGDSKGEYEVHNSSSGVSNGLRAYVSARTAFPADPAFPLLLPVQQRRSISFERDCEKLASAMTSISDHPPIFYC